jgi:protein YibB
MSDVVTIVTAFYDLGRGSWAGEKNGRIIPHYVKRDENTYLERFERLTKLKNPIIVFTQTKYFDIIKSMRSDIVCIGIDDVFEMNDSLVSKIRDIQSSQHFINFVNNPELPEYWSPEYVLINFLKSFFVNVAVENKLCATSTSAWIDFGYVRDDTFCPEGMEWKFQTHNLINLFAIDNPSTSLPIFELIKTNTVIIQGCHIVASNELWKTMHKLMMRSLNSLLDVDLIDDDQTLMLMSYKKEPNKFKINFVDRNDWFVIFKNFNN